VRFSLANATHHTIIGKGYDAYNKLANAAHHYIRAYTV